MEFTRATYAKVSPDGQYLASLHGNHLIVRDLQAGYSQSHALPASYKNRWMVWHTPRSADIGLSEESSLPTASCSSYRRLLIADEVNVRVFDALDPQWKAVIKGAAGIAAHIANIAFGRDHDQIMVFSSFGLRVMIWSLITSRGAEIKDPKSLRRAYDIRPQSAHLALLTRPSAHDCLVLLDTKTNEVYRNIDVATTDAQGIRWSPDGRWLAIQDTTSAGYKILIYTTDGHLFKVLQGGQDDENVGLGAKNMMWSPNAQLLAVGDAEERVILYNSTTVRFVFVTLLPTFTDLL